MSVPLTAKQIVALVIARYSTDRGWVTQAEVMPPEVEGAKARRLDAAAFGLWSRGERHVIGFEIKVSRSDWLSELADTSKAEPGLRACSEWWVVAPKGVVQNGELPEGWGLMVINKKGDGLRQQAAAAVRGERDAGWLLRRWVLRYLYDKDGTRAAERDKSYREGLERGRNEAERTNLTHEQERLVTLGEAADELQKRIGTELWTMTYRDVAAWELLMRLKAHGDKHSALQRMLESAERQTRAVADHLAEIGAALEIPEEATP